MNDTFRQLLNDKNGQVKFVELQPRRDVLPARLFEFRSTQAFCPPAKSRKIIRKPGLKPTCSPRGSRKRDSKNYAQTRGATWRFFVRENSGSERWPQPYDVPVCPLPSNPKAN